MVAPGTAVACPECGRDLRSIRFRLDPRTATADPFGMPCRHPLDGRTVARCYARGLYVDMPPLSGASLVAAERERQITEEGHTAAADDLGDPNALRWAAWCYLDAAAPDAIVREDVPPMWPYAPSAWKPERAPMRLLIIAGALVAAEIDRRLRAGESPVWEEPEPAQTRLEPEPVPAQVALAPAEEDLT